MSPLTSSLMVWLYSWILWPQDTCHHITEHAPPQHAAAAVLHHFQLSDLCTFSSRFKVLTGSNWVATLKSCVCALACREQGKLCPSFLFQLLWWAAEPCFGNSLLLERVFGCWAANRIESIGSVQFSVTSGAVVKVELVMPSSLLLGEHQSIQRENEANPQKQLKDGL